MHCRTPHRRTHATLAALKPLAHNTTARWSLCVSLPLHTEDRVVEAVEELRARFGKDRVKVGHRATGPCSHRARLYCPFANVRATPCRCWWTGVFPRRALACYGMPERLCSNRTCLRCRAVGEVPLHAASQNTPHTHLGSPCYSRLTSCLKGTLLVGQKCPSSLPSTHGPPAFASRPCTSCFT